MFNLGRGVLSAALALGFGCLVASSASAVPVTPVAWSGSGFFNDSEIHFTGFAATSFSGVTGFGLYSGCCSNGTPTTFKLSLELNGVWTTASSLQWSVPGTVAGDLIPRLMSSLGLSYNFGSQMTVTGIKLESDPNGVPTLLDPNFTLFRLGPFDTTFFNFDLAAAAPTPTPLPAALPLMATILGGAGFAAWRRRRKQAA